jgi:prepilin-type N-terminal cleavage/methylation domain-containing protein
MNTKRAFTIIETLVAISILLIALTGPLTIAAKGLSSSIYARDQITAFYLAQEGIEYIRNIRDTNSLDSSLDRSQWLNNLSSCIGAKCRIDAHLKPGTAGAITSCAGDSNPDNTLTCEPLMLDSGVSGIDLYDYSLNGAPSIYTREIVMTKITDDEYKIVSTVSWRSPLPNHSFTLQEDITNWEK